MAYRETLDFIRANKLNVLDIEVANECDSVFDFKYTDEEFEDLCGFVNYIYLETEDITILEIVCTINRLIKDENMSIGDVIEMHKWEFIDEIVF